MPSHRDYTINIQQIMGFVKKFFQNEMDINESAVQKQLDVLRKKGLVRRVGPDKVGHWEVQD